MKKLLSLVSVAFMIHMVFPSVAFAGGLNAPENLHIDHIECGTAPKAYAYFNWNAVDGDSSVGSYKAEAYRFYSRLPEGTYTSYDVTKDTSYKLGFNPEYTFYITVASIYTDSQGNVAESRSQEVYLQTSQCHPASAQAQTQANSVQSVVAQPHVQPILPQQPVADPIMQKPAPLITSAVLEKNTNDEEVSQLNKKVAKLEEDLEQSKKKQNALEKNMNNLLSWLRIHLPFFK